MTGRVTLVLLPALGALLAGCGEKAEPASKSADESSGLKVTTWNLPGDPAFESQIPERFTHVYRIGNFYIMGTNQRPRETDRGDRSGKEVVLQATRLFGSLLDTDADGQIDRPDLLATMGKNFAFAIGTDRALRPIEESLHQQTGHYIISMKTDIWPFFPNWDGTGFKLQGLDSSMWRPDGMNALWEECFHVYTEAWNRHSKRWSFGRRGLLGRAMAADIRAGHYDIAEQNRMEEGHYDWSTAVNEYVHQIWLINQSGQSPVLTTNQREVLMFLQETKRFPLRMNKDYVRKLAVKVR
ncbi:MAG: hypothetical protein CMP31_04410 [Roseibacillus sp.]|jgi:hypothetical protein|nr:hypothetical protein [Roseibacillus sp.]MCP4729350.1 hypothetical protein [Roseibacillus sp.]MDP6113587.1 hypothetical protein [Planctomycetota bacterium]|tara:strand:+ start:2492 stop:3382 length:891 start_codon:yes stop_codon:yes gene_type:complete